MTIEMRTVVKLLVSLDTSYSAPDAVTGAVTKGLGTR